MCIRLQCTHNQKSLLTSAKSKKRLRKIKAMFSHSTAWMRNIHQWHRTEEAQIKNEKFKKKLQKEDTSALRLHNARQLELLCESNYSHLLWALTGANRGELSQFPRALSCHPVLCLTWMIEAALSECVCVCLELGSLWVHLGCQAGLIKGLVSWNEIGLPQERDGQLGHHRTL